MSDKTGPVRVARDQLARGGSWHPILANSTDPKLDHGIVLSITEDGSVSGLEEWMWKWVQNRTRPDWAHDGICSGDLNDLVAATIQRILDEAKEPKP